jgi:hypothetical protein
MSVPGRLLYQLWHRPLGALRTSLRHGGPLATRATRRARDEMRAAAADLPPLPAPTARPLVVHFLTGRAFAYQTAFCLHSLARHCPAGLAPEFHDDGTLTGDAHALLARLAPAAVFHPQTEALHRLESHLPATRFPVLRERWVHYPHIRKLIDVHLGRSGWRLVLDSDLLFWRRPDLLLDWSDAPRSPLHATDCTENYGYPRPLLEQLAGRPVPPLVNVGLIALRSEAIDWAFLEHASARLISAHGTHYYLEQALCALLVARSPAPAVVAPAADYVTFPSPAEVAAPSAVMHHYVDLSRDLYHRQAWRRLVSTPA